MPASRSNDRYGSPRWARLMGGATQDNARGVTEATDGALFAVGFFEADITLTAADAEQVELTSGGFLDGYLVRFPE